MKSRSALYLTGPAPDLIRGEGEEAIAGPFVASETGTGIFCLGFVRSSQSLTSNAARICGSFVALEPVSDVRRNIWMPDQVRHDGMRRHSGGGRNPA